jgi:uncharacterized protein YjbJ (UPF0337 family)
MGTIKRTTRKAAGKAKEALAEVLGDGKLQEQARAEQAESEDEQAEDQAEDKESDGLNPLRNLNRLT